MLDLLPTIERFYYSFSIMLPILLFAFKTPKKPHFALRLILCFLAVAIVDLASAPLMDHPANVPLAVSYTPSIFFFFIEFALGVLTCLICFEENFMCALYCSIAGYCIQHIWGKTLDYAVYRLLDYYLPSMSYLQYPIGVASLIGVCFLFYYWILRKMNPTNGNYAENNTAQIIVSFMVVGVNIIFNTYAFTSLIEIDRANPQNVLNLSGQITTLYVFVSFMSAFAAFLSLFILISLYLSKQIKNEKEELNKMLSQQKEQFEAQKENIALVNIKCHDLKHQLSAMEGKLSEEQIKETVHSINLFDSTYRTGNEAIDIVLASKHIALEKKRIQLTCSLDGALISYIPSYELYSIFGNAIDNAIESVQSLSEEKRIIHISQEQKGNILSIKIQNFYENQLNFRDGLPQTTKGDSGYHGFGVKSIKMLMEKYDGTVSISAENGIFTLVLLFLTRQNPA
jgi:hypothetical protein